MPTNPVTDQADSELLYEILYTLKEGNDDQRAEAIKNQVPKLRDKQAARERLIELLAYGAEEDKSAWAVQRYSEIRGWAATALEKLRSEDDRMVRGAIIKHLQTEKDAVARYWMVLALYRMGSPKDKDVVSVVTGIADGFEKYINSFGPIDNPEVEGPMPGPDHRAGPLTLAILASWRNQGAAKTLEKMLRSAHFEWMWSACRALEVVSCREMLEPLRHVVEDPRTWPDVRNKAVIAIGLIESPAAARVLGQVLTGARDVIIKESAIEGLEQLGQSRLVRGMLDQLHRTGEAQYSVADSLMVALMDSNAQIRRRAAEALPKVMIDPQAYTDDDDEAYDKALAQARIPATGKAVSEIIRETVDVKTGIPLLVDALRVIDPPEAEAAATVLSKYLFSEDVSVKQRAEHALRLVGGEKAVQTLMGQKSEVLRTYNDLLARADEPIQALFRETMRQAQRSFNISQGMSVTVFIIGVGALIAGLYVAFTAGQDGIQRIFGAGTSIVGIIAVVLDMMLRDPHKRVQEATSVLLRTKVIFLGYVRQIHQVDATFKHEFIEGGKDFGVKDVQDTIKQISDVMKNTMDLIDLHLSVRKAEKLAVEEVLKPWQERLEAAMKTAEDKPSAPTEKGKEQKETSDTALKDSTRPANR